MRRTEWNQIVRNYVEAWWPSHNWGPDSEDVLFEELRPFSSKAVAETLAVLRRKDVAKGFRPSPSTIVAMVLELAKPEPRAALPGPCAHKQRVHEPAVVYPPLQQWMADMLAKHNPTETPLDPVGAGVNRCVQCDQTEPCPCEVCEQVRSEAMAAAK